MNLSVLGPSKMVDWIELGKEKYAVVSPNKITFLKEASEKELQQVIQEEIAGVPKLSKSSMDDEKVNGITFLPTFNCNLRCIYCYAKGGEERDNMTNEIAKTALDNFAASHKIEEVNIYFAGGGEPFLNFKVMQFIIDYARSLFKKINIRMVTNGTFNKEQLQWILDNNIETRISFDGLASNFQRPFTNKLSSRSIVEKNIKELVRLGKEFAIQCVVTGQSVSMIKDNVKYLYSLGARNLKIEPVHISPISRSEGDLRAPTSDEFVYNYIEMLKYVKEEGLDVKLDSSFISRPTLGYYCGIRNKIIVTPSGDITGCVEITRKGEPFSDIVINGCYAANRKTEFDEQSKEKLYRLHFSSYKKCMDCNLKLICRGGCPMRNLFESPDSFEPSNYMCEIEKKLAPKVLSLVADDQEYGQLIFDNVSVEVC